MKKLFAMLLILALTVSVVGCGAEAPEAPVLVTPQPRPAQTEAPQPTPEAPDVQTLSLSVDSGSGELTVLRPEPNQLVPMGEKNTWTVFVYLCGADLESDVSYGMGMATEDVREMCAAAQSDNMSAATRPHTFRNNFTFILNLIVCLILIDLRTTGKILSRIQNSTDAI